MVNPWDNVGSCPFRSLRVFCYYPNSPSCNYKAKKSKCPLNGNASLISCEKLFGEDLYDMPPKKRCPLCGHILPKFLGHVMRTKEDVRKYKRIHERMRRLKRKSEFEIIVYKGALKDE